MSTLLQLLSFHYVPEKFIYNRTRYAPNATNPMPSFCADCTYATNCTMHASKDHRCHACKRTHAIYPSSTFFQSRGRPQGFSILIVVILISNNVPGRCITISIVSLREPAHEIRNAGMEFQDEALIACRHEQDTISRVMTHAIPCHLFKTSWQSMRDISSYPWKQHRNHGAALYAIVPLTVIPHNPQTSQWISEDCSSN
jgi:hypothetical protein